MAQLEGAVAQPCHGCSASIANVLSRAADKLAYVRFGYFRTSAILVGVVDASRRTYAARSVGGISRVARDRKFNASPFAPGGIITVSTAPKARPDISFVPRTGGLGKIDS
jgi:hypothetical protein